MALKTVSGFTKGMVTDVVGADDSLYTLHDAYVRRASEIVSRGRVVHAQHTVSAPTGSAFAGTTQMCFHPDIGTLRCEGVHTSGATARLTSASNFQLFGAGLQSSAVIASVEPSVTWGRVTESTNNLYAFINSGGSTVPMDWITRMDTTQAEIILSGRNGRLYRWGGSILPSYTSGTCETTSGSQIIVASTSASDWAASVEAGMFIMVSGVNNRSIGGTQYERPFRITKVIANYTGNRDAVEVNATVADTVSNAAYRISPVALVMSPSGVWNTADDMPRSAGPMAIHAGRCFVAAPSDNSSDYNTVYQWNRIRWSGRIGDPGETTTSATATYGDYSGIDLWHANGYVDIDPVGGAIRGLVSLGNQLVILKSNAMYRMVGNPTLDYSVSQEVAISKIADGVGANGDYAYGLCKAGVIVASQNGLFLYDGNQLKSLTKGRVQRWWEDHFRSAQLAVICFDDKVIVNTYGPSNSYYGSLIWQIDEDYFWTADLTRCDGSNDRLTCGATLFSSTDDYVGDYVGGWESGYNTSILPTKILTHITHKGYDGVAAVQDKASNLNTAEYPRPNIVTNAIPLGPNQASEGRVNTIYIAGVAATGNSADIPVKVLTGLTSDGDINQASEGVNTTTTLPYGMDNDGLDRMHRIPCDGIDPSPAAKVQITPSSVYGALRIYAISVDAAETNVVT